MEMAKARPRYVCIGRYRFNDVDLAGQRFILIHRCTYAGEPKARRKKDLSHARLRFEDPKWVKANSLPVTELIVSGDCLSKFFEEAK
jgi:hypothetical protein